MSKSFNLAVSKRNALLETQRIFSKWVADSVKDAPLAELEFRLGRLDEDYPAFRDATIIIEATEFEDEDYAEHAKKRSDYETNYFTLRAAVIVAIDQLKARVREETAFGSPLNQSREESEGSGVKLERIAIEPFDGSFDKYIDFKNTFDRLVHNNKELKSDVEKMFRLKKCLTGEALRAVGDLQLSDENYALALKILEKRFYNKRIIASSHIKALLQLRPVRNASASEIRLLMDTVNVHLGALNSIGRPTKQYEDLLVFIIMSRIDEKTLGKWEDDAPTDRLATLDEFFEFLEKRCQHIECGTVDFNLGKPSTKQSPAPRSNNKATSHVATAASGDEERPRRGKTCNFCLKSGHFVYICGKMRKMEPRRRLEEVRRLSLCECCLQPGHNATNCGKCGARHSGYLHDALAGGVSATTGNGNTNAATSNAIASTSSASLSAVALPTQSESRPNGVKQVLLSTALVNVVDSAGELVPVRALLDNGSQKTIIAETLVEKLRLKRFRSFMNFGGVGGVKSESKYICTVSVRSRVCCYSIALNAHILPKITSPQPSSDIDTSSWPIPANITLADPNFGVTAPIELLLGADIFWDVLSVGQIRPDPELPVLQNTVFGWVVGGQLRNSISHHAQCLVATLLDQQFQSNFERFCEVESAGSESAAQARSLDDIEAEREFNEHVSRDQTGRYVVPQLFKESPAVLGDSKAMAVRRFYAMERRLQEKPPALKSAYVKFMEEYESRDYMVKVSPRDVPPHAQFLPHLYVERPDSSSTPLRVVFDASAKTNSGKSINDILRVGPTIQQDLFAILARFRTYQVVLGADITKMFLQILMRGEDQHYQYVVWRPSPAQSLDIYRLKTVTFGFASAPFLACATLRQMALDYKDEFPLASARTLTDFYVDNLLTGFASVQEALRARVEFDQMLGAAGMELRKWSSNSDEVLAAIEEDKREPLRCIGDKEALKTLGIMWLPRADKLQIVVQLPGELKRVTKRIALSEMASIFDPLGLTAPVITSAKLYMQRVHALKQNWDAALPQEMHSWWLEFHAEIKLLEKLEFPRLIIPFTIVSDVQLHCFGDASEKAIGAALYVRCQSPEGAVLVHLVAAKSKVASKKHPTTIPKLELCAAELAANLLRKVASALDIEISRAICWSDSTTALAWIAAEPDNFKQFVRTRNVRIRQLQIDEWRYVPTRLNPAGTVSRGARPKELLGDQLWKFGPEFLRRDIIEWPAPPNQPLQEDELPDQKKNCAVVAAVATSPDIFDTWRHLDYRQLRNRVERMCLFINKCRQKAEERAARTAGRSVTKKAVWKADEAIVFVVQRHAFGEDIARLEAGKTVIKKSRMRSLNPFLDEKHIIRVGGRLARSNLSYDTKHPMVLPTEHPVSAAIMRHLHVKFLHVGPKSLLAFTRQQFWPLSGLRLANSIVHKCRTCVRAKPKPFAQLMADLPPARVAPSPAFYTVAVDYAGPFYVYLGLRGKAPIKAYLSIFVCFTTKAVHMEVVLSLTTDAFLGALTRFAATRGLPKRFYSDNGTQFAGARSELQELFKLFQSKELDEKVKAWCREDGIVWQFAPPSSPHHNGLAESAVKSAKHHLKRIMGNAHLRIEEFLTLTKQVEAILNTRPLCTLSSSPDDSLALTPGHFLIHRPLNAVVRPVITDEKINLTQRWRYETQLEQHFWKRWSHEYLIELQQRRKWSAPERDLEVGEMVVIRDENLPPLRGRSLIT